MKISGIIFNVYVTHVSSPGRNPGWGEQWGGEELVAIPLFYCPLALTLLSTLCPGLCTDLLKYYSWQGARSLNMVVHWGEHPRLSPMGVK